MPSAEPKQETMAASDASDPFQKAISYLKYKIKNMEQRKKNLEGIQERIAAGQGSELERAQVQAIEKLPEVTSNIGFLEQTLARLLQHKEETCKLERARKQQLKLERLHHDHERLRRVLVIQDALVNIDERVRAALLAGTGGAPQLTETQLEQIDAIYKLVTPCRDDDTPIKDQISSAAEHLLRLVDRSQKKVTGTTYETLGKTLEAVFDSGVLCAPEPEPAAEPEPPVENGAVEELEPPAPEQPEPAPPAPVEPAPVPVAPVPVAPVPVAPVPVAPAEPPAAPLEPMVAAGAAPGSAGDGPAYPQEVLVPVLPTLPPRPTINFLQESELLRADPAVVGFQPGPAPEYHQIPSQTFTNTNFAGLPSPAAALSDFVSAGGVYAAPVVDTTPNPPPPIPMPPQQQQPEPSPPPPAAPPAAVPPPQPHADSAWTSAAAARQPATVAPEPAVTTAPPAAAVPTPAAAAPTGWDADTEIGEWDASAAGRGSWDGAAKQTDWAAESSKQNDWASGGKQNDWADNSKHNDWPENGDSHWSNSEGRRGGGGGYRGRGGGPRGRAQSNGGFGGRGRGGYDRPPRNATRYDERRGYDDRRNYDDRDNRRGGYDDRDSRRGGYDDRRGGYDDRRGGERPYRGVRGGGASSRGARGSRGGGPPRQQ